jgi:cyclopropane-fatty-acyl-phospholipid synthase
MDLERWFLEHTLQGTLPLPGPLLQRLLNAYMRAFYRVETIFGRAGGEAAPSAEIAARSRELMEAHYNMPLTVFSHCLGATMKYSAGLWETGAGSLDEAQEAMMDDTCAKAGLRDGQRVLDLGCGFGSFAAHVLRRFPSSRVWGVTLSGTQADYLRACQSTSGHPLSTDRFYLVQADFNDVAFDQPFDRIVSLGVFEHVSNLDRALARLGEFLAHDGLCFLHYIVYRARPDGSDAPRSDGFIDRYIFPGGRVWAMSELARHLGPLRLERDWFLNGRNYRRTLEAWLANFLAHRERIHRETALPPRWLRLWELYLRCSIATFNTQGGRLFGNGQYLLRVA